VNANPLLQVLRDASAALEAAQVRYALIGGIAAILHGSTRATRDVDIAVNLIEDQQRRLIDALQQGGFSNVVHRGSVIQAVHHSSYRLDLLLVESPFEDAIVEAATPRSMPGCPSVRVASVTDVVAFKIVGGRPRDLRDIEELAEENPAMDWNRVCDLLRILGVQVEPREWTQAVAADDLRTLLRRLAAAIRQ